MGLFDYAKDTFQEVLGAIRRTPYSLYLLIDEYDNFANEVMVRDEETYSGLVHGVGPYKELMKTVKSASQGQGLERLFVTGVSPVVMSDLSSGMNILSDVYQRPELSALCGFKDDEIVALLERLRASEPESPAWTVEQTRKTIRDWYNGYRFSPSSEEQVYNPTMALYFLDHLQRYQESPRQLLDANLAADEDKLRFIGEIVSGQQTLLDVVQKDTPIEIDSLAGRRGSALPLPGRSLGALRRGTATPNLRCRSARLRPDRGTGADHLSARSGGGMGRSLQSVHPDIVLNIRATMSSPVVAPRVRGFL